MLVCVLADPQVCPFDSVKQDYTSLGTWGKWKDNYTVMHFVNGQMCHGGTMREATVRLECGVDNQLTSVTEPSMCRYEMVLITPAACVE